MVTEIQPHTLPRPKGLIECNAVLDIGAGIRPMQWYTPKWRHICVEPYPPYCDVLRTGSGHEVWCSTAEGVLEGLPPGIHGPRLYGIGAIYLLDVLEHMEKAEGRRVIDLACQVAERQVVVYTPLGFVEQTRDVWELGGEYWQTHRSGWLPEEFPDWTIEYFQPPNKSKPEGFYALWKPISIVS